MSDLTAPRWSKDEVVELRAENARLRARLEEVERERDEALDVEPFKTWYAMLEPEDQTIVGDLVGTLRAALAAAEEALEPLYDALGGDVFAASPLPDDTLIRMAEQTLTTTLGDLRRARAVRERLAKTRKITQ